MRVVAKVHRCIVTSRARIPMFYTGLENFRADFLLEIMRETDWNSPYRIGKHLGILTRGSCLRRCEVLSSLDIFGFRLSKTDLIDQKPVSNDCLCISSIDIGGPECHSACILYNLRQSVSYHV